MNKIHFTQGWTLVELMIVVGIIGVLASIAVPSYNSYIKTSELGVVRMNAETLAGFEDVFFYEGGTYLAGSYIPGGTDDLTGSLGWNPSSDKDNFEYVVAAGACVGGITQCMTVTVTSVASPSISATVTRP